MKRSQRAGKSGIPSGHGSKLEVWFASEDEARPGARARGRSPRIAEEQATTGQAVSMPIARYTAEGPPQRRRSMAVEGFAMVLRRGKTLIIAEKPSVGRDLAAALPGAFQKEETHLESDEYVITWAVGHLSS